MKLGLHNDTGKKPKARGGEGLAKVHVPPFLQSNINATSQVKEILLARRGVTPINHEIKSSGKRTCRVS